MSTSWVVWLRSLATVVSVAVVGAGGSNVEIASSLSIDAGSVFFSTKPSPCASAIISCALIRSTSWSKCRRMRASDARAVRRLEQHLDGEIERRARLLEMAQCQLALARTKCRCDSAMSSATGSLAGAGSGVRTSATGGAGGVTVTWTGFWRRRIRDRYGLRR